MSNNGEVSYGEVGEVISNGANGNGALKPGWKTTEWFITVFSSVIAFLVILGYVKKEDADTLNNSIGNIVVAVSALITQGLIIWRYIQSRTELKKLQQ